MKLDSFNLSEWLNIKLEAEKTKYQKLKHHFQNVKSELELMMEELKNDSHYMVPFINGLLGDRLAEKKDKALIEMSFRYLSRDIKVEDLKKIYQFNKHAGKIVIMIHGLMNDEFVWQSEHYDEAKRLGSQLEIKAEATLLYIRYNTGLHISENGRKLSTLLENLINLHKEEMSEVSIIAHSMGGLVTRSACHYGSIDKRNWPSLLRNIILIGVPNEGSYLARIAQQTQNHFKKLDLTEKKIIASFFDIRSNGIKDLSYGILVDEDWKKAEESNYKKITCSIILPLPDVKYFLIAATLSDENKKYRILNFFGDGLVEEESALSGLFKNRIYKSGSVSMKLFNKENHVTLLESSEVEKYIRNALNWSV